MLQEQEHEGLEEEDDDEPVFVLTDEWREFFAKSEAKRKLGSGFSPAFLYPLKLVCFNLHLCLTEKKQAKKNGKK